MSGGAASLELQTALVKAYFQRTLPVYDRVEIVLARRVPAINAAPNQISELFGGGYTRAVALLSPSWWSIDADGTCYLDRELVFPVATGNWGYVPGWAMYSKKATGVWQPTTLATGRLQQPKKITVGQRFRLPRRSLSFDFTDVG